jgi:hypothetical protein
MFFFFFFFYIKFRNDGGGASSSSFLSSVFSYSANEPSNTLACEPWPSAKMCVQTRSRNLSGEIKNMRQNETNERKQRSPVIRFATHHRSWLTTIPLPAKSSNEFSRFRKTFSTDVVTPNIRVKRRRHTSTSRSFVGSSSINTFGPSRIHQ